MNINWKWMLIGVVAGVAIAAAIVQKGSDQLASTLKLRK
jgi:uncharacterized membrane-anchored protein YhcB (DUF1043 family)